MLKDQEQTEKIEKTPLEQSRNRKPQLPLVSRTALSQVLLYYPKAKVKADHTRWRLKSVEIQDSQAS